MEHKQLNLQPGGGTEKTKEIFVETQSGLFLKKSLFSRNFISKRSGWRVDSNGEVEINTLAKGVLNFNGGAVEGLDYVSGTSGGIDFNETGRIEISNHLDPAGAGTLNLGGATRYWGDISYKTLTDRGCLGWYDDGVKLRNGTTVTDLEALTLIQKHPTLTTPAGAPRLDYTTLPADVYVKPVDHDGTELQKDAEGNYYKEVYDKKTRKVVRVSAQEGAETTALISIMLGAIKELDLKLKAQDAEIKKLKGV